MGIHAGATPNHIATMPPPRPSMPKLAVILQQQTEKLKTNNKVINNF